MSPHPAETNQTPDPSLTTPCLGGLLISEHAMKHNLILLCLAMLVASPILARDKTDVILMKNGDRFTCEIKGLSSNILYYSISYFLGTVSFVWSKVDRIEITQLFMVKTHDGTVYTG